MIHVLVRRSGTMKPIPVTYCFDSLCQSRMWRTCREWETGAKPSCRTYLWRVHPCNSHSEALDILGLRISPSPSFYFLLILSEGDAKEHTASSLDQSTFTDFCFKDQFQTCQASCTQRSPHIFCSPVMPYCISGKILGLNKCEEFRSKSHRIKSFKFWDTKK